MFLSSRLHDRRFALWGKRGERDISRGARRSCRAPREISRSPRLAHKAPVMQATPVVTWYAFLYCKS